MAATDLQFTAGTTFAFDLTWQTKTDGGELVPVDITGCTACFQMREIASGKLLAQAKTEGDGIALNAGAEGDNMGKIAVSIHPSKTRGLKSFVLGKVAYELRVYFPSGDVYSLMSGFVAISEGVILEGA
ncbi:hypothetical protein HQQ92_22975 [Shewanella sp. DC2-4]|uniref:hypothetical protein n=1 Tax=Shewanella sp. DC2-4 TaxID=2739431 RepID=UPI001564A5A1|nr:hypothetical protein [Shewanella sp. DC2-4]NRD34581.1 hypothetical protein [Shewanella sp. DC2-4]